MRRIKVKDCISMGLWDKYCKLTNTDQYAINKGDIGYNDYIELTEEFKSLIENNINGYLL